MLFLSEIMDLPYFLFLLVFFASTVMKARIPPIIANTVIVPFVLLKVYKLEGTYWFFAMTVCLGEVISCGVLGTLLRKSLEKSNLFDKLK